MTNCEKCGKSLSFFQTLLGKQICTECVAIDRQNKEAQKIKALAELHKHLEENLKATSIDQLKEFGTHDSDFATMMNSLAHSIKSNEKIFAICLAKAQKSKYIKSKRYSTSVPVFGLKGWRMSSGESIPIYDLVDVGTGVLALTNQNIHLCAASGKPMKIPYSKIEGFHLYDNGMELYHGSQTPTYFIFKEADPIESDVIGHIIGLYTR